MCHFWNILNLLIIFPKFKSKVLNFKIKKKKNFKEIIGNLITEKKANSKQKKDLRAYVGLPDWWLSVLLHWPHLPRKEKINIVSLYLSLRALSTSPTPTPPPLCLCLCLCLSLSSSRSSLLSVLWKANLRLRLIFLCFHYSNILSLSLSLSLSL